MNLQSEIFSFGDLLESLNIFNNDLCGLQFEQDQPKSAVAIIVKKQRGQTLQKKSQIASFVQDQILFLQRKISPKDRFSGQICFPGGRQQPNQTLLNTAVRQTFEQTNILLTQQNLVGCVNRQVNFIISSKKQLESMDRSQNTKPKKQMVVYAFIFIVQSEFIDAQSIKLNYEEMETYQWVKAHQITNPRNLCFLDYTQKISGLAKAYEQYPGVKNNLQVAFDCVGRALSPAMNLKMNQKMYGITFYIILIVVTHLAQKIKFLITQAESLPSEKIYLLKTFYCNLTQIKQRSLEHVIFELKKPISLEFRQFQKSLLSELYKMRPKL